MTKKNPAEPAIDKIRLSPPKIKLTESAKFYEQKSEENYREYLRRTESAGD
jgi:hypothetical protein